MCVPVCVCASIVNNSKRTKNFRKKQQIQHHNPQNTKKSDKKFESGLRLVYGGF